MKKEDMKTYLSVNNARNVNASSVFNECLLSFVAVCLTFETKKNQSDRLTFAVISSQVFGLTVPCYDLIEQNCKFKSKTLKTKILNAVLQPFIVQIVCKHDSFELFFIPKNKKRFGRIGTNNMETGHVRYHSRSFDTTDLCYWTSLN